MAGRTLFTAATYLMVAGLAVYVLALALACWIFISGAETQALGAAWAGLIFASFGYAGFAFLALPAAIYSYSAAAPRHGLDTPLARALRWLVLAATVLPYVIYRCVAR